MALQGLLLLLLLVLFRHSFSCYSNPEAFDDEIAEGPEGSITESFSPAGGPGTLGRGMINVEDYGARGDGFTDNTKVFNEAWNMACSSPTSTVLLVPENGRFFLKSVIFSGPCESHVTLLIKGTLQASDNPSDWNERNRRHWILFQDVRNLIVGGGGTLDGKGMIWWQNSCKINKYMPCTVAPTALTFYACNELRVEDLKIKDSQQIHLSIERCRNVKVSKLAITAPGWSPNTDGIHVAYTKNLLINDCVIRTGDDCISIETGCYRVRGMNIVCGPGHGISIGSLGENNSRARVSFIKMDNVKLVGTTNGVRIKTYQGGHGYARNIIFQNVYMHYVANPIIVDQNYCDTDEPCLKQGSSVAVSKVIYKNIKGISTSKVAIRLDCSKTIPCHGIVLHDIKLVGEHGGFTQSLCRHVKWSKIGMVMPQPCTKHL